MTMNDLKLLAMQAWSASSDEGILVTDLDRQHLPDQFPFARTAQTAHDAAHRIGSAATGRRRDAGARRSVSRLRTAAYHTQWGNLRIQHYPPRRLIWQRMPLAR